MLPPRRLPRSGCRPSLFLQNEANSSPIRNHRRDDGGMSLNEPYGLFCSLPASTNSQFRRNAAELDSQGYRDSLFPLRSWALSLIVNRCFGCRRLRGSLE
jgi:hypothetical protein